MIGLEVPSNSSPSGEMSFGLNISPSSNKSPFKDMVAGLNVSPLISYWRYFFILMLFTTKSGLVSVMYMLLFSSLEQVLFQNT